MRLTGTDDTDIMLDANGQPVTDTSGAPQLVTGKECWLQDIRCEMLTEEGELFHEDEEGKEAYGYGLLEFLNAETDIFEEIRARIFEKLSKRTYIDESSISVEVSEDTTRRTNVRISFSSQESSSDSNEIDISMNGTEVYVK